MKQIIWQNDTTPCNTIGPVCSGLGMHLQQAKQKNSIDCRHRIVQLYLTATWSKTQVSSCERSVPAKSSLCPGYMCTKTWSPLAPSNTYSKFTNVNQESRSPHSYKKTFWKCQSGIFIVPVNCFLLVLYHHPTMSSSDRRKNSGDGKT